MDVVVIKENFVNQVNFSKTWVMFSKQNLINI